MENDKFCRKQPLCYYKNPVGELFTKSYASYLLQVKNLILCIFVNFIVQAKLKVMVRKKFLKFKSIQWLFQCLKYNSKIKLMTCFKHRLHSVICNRYLELKAFYSTLQSHLHLMHLSALRFLPGYVLTRGNLLNNSFSKLFNDS